MTSIFRYVHANIKPLVDPSQLVRFMKASLSLKRDEFCMADRVKQDRYHIRPWSLVQD